MVVGRERSDSARKRTLRDLCSVGAIVGCVALGVAVLVSPAAENFRTVVPDARTVHAPEVEPRVGDVAVEVRPGAAVLRRPSVTSLAPGQLVLAPPPLTTRVGSVIASVPVEAPVVLASTSDLVADIAPPAVVVTEPALVGPVATAPVDTLTAQSSTSTSTSTSPGKSQGVATAKGLAKPKSTKTAKASSGVTAMSVSGSGKATESPGHQQTADTAPPRDQHQGRAPEHAAAHQPR